MFPCLPLEWGQPTEPAFDCMGAFPMGKNLGRERQTCRCRSRWVSGSFKHSSAGQVPSALMPACVSCQMFPVGQGSTCCWLLLAAERLFASNAEKSAQNLAG